MEGSESEEVFDSLNINPQLFINEVLNLVDDLLDEAFDFYHQQASTLLKIEGTDKSEDLSKGIVEIRDLIQSVLDKRLVMWEKYCMQCCFTVPEGFSLPKNVHLFIIETSWNISSQTESLGDSSTSLDALCDPDLDAQLAFLRNKLIAVDKESAELNCELRELERQSISTNYFAGLINEAVQLYDQNSLHDMHQEIERAASELRTKMEQLNSQRMQEIERSKMEKIYNPGRDVSMMNPSKGLFIEELKDLQELLDEL